MLLIDVTRYGLTQNLWDVCNHEPALWSTDVYLPVGLNRRDACSLYLAVIQLHVLRRYRSCESEDQAAERRSYFTPKRSAILCCRVSIYLLLYSIGGSRFWYASVSVGVLAEVAVAFVSQLVGERGVLEHGHRGGGTAREWSVKFI